MGKPKYSIVLIPKTHPSQETWKGLVLRQKEFRLAALQASPKSFGSTYDREVAFEFDVWDKRLGNPSADTFVAIQSENGVGHDNSGVETLLYQPWVGVIVLTGPMADHTSVDPLVKGTGVVATAVDSPVESIQTSQARGPGSVPHYQLNALYVSPSTRGAGLGKLLMDAAIEHAVAKASDAPAARLTLIVDHYNKSARSLYKRCDFQTIRRYFFDDPRLTKHAEDPPGQTEAAVMERIVQLHTRA